MNRIITIYGITKLTRAMVLERHDRVRYIDTVTIDGQSLAVGDTSTAVKLRELDVHRLMVNGEEQFIAIEPGLREILELPFEAEVRSVREWAEGVKERADGDVAMATRRTRQMLAMPWWRRMWFAAFKRNLVS